ncbi:hypothetical protein ES703_85641 [subsurface metagenome]
MLSTSAQAFSFAAGWTRASERSERAAKDGIPHQLGQASLPCRAIHMSPHELCDLSRCSTRQRVNRAIQPTVPADGATGRLRVRAKSGMMKAQATGWTPQLNSALDCIAE